MKVKDGFLMRPVMDKFVIVPVGEQTLDFQGIITCNETGAFLWKCLQEEQTEETLTEALLSEYEVAPEQAAADVKQFVQLLQNAELLQAAN